MSKLHLGGFRNDGHSYEHSINTETDATELLNDVGEVLYTVDSFANVFDRAGRIGNFYTNDFGAWYFKGVSGMIIETGNQSLIKAEMKVFKHFLRS